MISPDEEEQLGLSSEKKASIQKKAPQFTLQSANKIMLISVIFAMAIITMIAHTESSIVKIQKQEEDQRYRTTTQQIIKKFNEKFRKKQQNVYEELPKILWIVLEKDRVSLPALEQIIINHMQFVHKKSSYQVRIINIKQAYSYLSTSMIEKMSEIMQTRRVDIDVTEIVRLALLIERGGVSITIGSTVLIQSLDWLKQVFNQFSEIQRNKIKNHPKLFLFKDNNRYLDFLIAAKPQSQFLWNCFHEMENILKYGRWPSPKEVTAYEQLMQTNVIRLNKILQSIINLRLKINYLSQTSMQQKNKIYYQQIQQSNQIKAISFQDMPALDLRNCFRKDKYFAYSPRYDLDSTCGKTKYLIYGIINRYKNLINEIIHSQNIDSIHPKSIFAQILNSAQNKKLWQPSATKDRWVNFCIIGPNPISNFTNISAKNLQFLTNQSYINWTAFYFYQFKQNNTQSFLFDNLQLFMKNTQAKTVEKIFFLDSKKGKNNQQVRSQNIEQAISNSCPRHSIGILLDLSQKMVDLKALQKIAQVMKKTEYFGVMLNIKNKQIIRQAKPLANRSCWTGRYDNSEQEMMLNNWRVFDTDLYKIIPPQNLHNLQGEYYSFLAAQLIMMSYSCPHNLNKISNSLTLRRFRQEMAFPQLLAILNITIESDQELNTNIQQLNEKFKFKPNALSLAYIVEDINKRKISYKKVLLFNQNTTILKSKINNKQRIPKIIHQIWIQGQIPPIRRELQQRNLAHHPDYKYLLWTKENITSENFPFTYRLLKNLYEFDKISTYSKMAMMADLIRYEVLYKYGGFYYDMNLELFKPLFDKWRSYRFISATEIQPRSRYSPIQSLIAAEKQYPPLLRLLQPSSINSINIFDPLTNVATGPYYYSQTVIGREELSPNILLIPYEQLFSFRDQENQNLCEIKYQHHWWESTSKMKQNQIHQIRKNCSSYYPNAIGLDHYIFGASWVHRRKKSRLVN